MCTGCLKTNSLTATVATRPRAMRPAMVPPAMSTCAMIQPPKMSPFWFASAGIGMTRSAGCLSGSRWPLGTRGRALEPGELHPLVADQVAQTVECLVPRLHVAPDLRHVPHRVVEALRQVIGRSSAHPMQQARL